MIRCLPYNACMPYVNKTKTKKHFDLWLQKNLYEIEWCIAYAGTREVPNTYRLREQDWLENWHIALPHKIKLWAYTMAAGCTLCMFVWFEMSHAYSFPLIKFHRCVKSNLYAPVFFYNTYFYNFFATTLCRNGLITIVYIINTFPQQNKVRMEFKNCSNLARPFWILHSRATDY